MIGLTRKMRVWAFTSPVDMRKGFDALYGLARSRLDRDPLEGDAFLFLSRNRRLAKVLLWDGTGLCVFSKRMERGRFAKLWGVTDGDEIQLTSVELSAYLDGWKMVGKTRLSMEEFRLPVLTKNDVNVTIQ
jgi:transposase